MTAAKFTVSGNVQGVGFRAFVQDVARSLNLNGEVYNARSGAVVVIAQSESPAALSALEAALQNGPGHVSSVRREPAEAVPGEGFRIGQSR